MSQSSVYSFCRKTTVHVQRKCHSLSAHLPASLPESPVTVATSKPHHLFLIQNFMPVTLRHAFRHILVFLPSLSVLRWETCFMINMFSHMACICHFVFYALPRASYGYIQCGFIPSVVWRFSNIFFQLFRCRNLALNRVFSYFLVAGMFCYTWQMSGHPLHSYAPIHSYTPKGVHTPILLCASVCSWMLCMLWGVVIVSLLC